MKQILLFLCVGILFSGCKNNDDYLFEMAYQTTFTIPAGINSFETHYFVIRDIPIGNYLNANNLTVADLASINPGACRMSTIFSGSSDYDFIFNISIEIFEDDQESGREVFFRDNVPLNTGEDLDLLPSLIDVSDNYEDGRFSLRVGMLLRNPPQQTVETRLNFSFLAK